MSQLSHALAWRRRLAAFFGLSAHIVLIVFIARFTIDTGTRMVFPFIPQFSTGLGLSVVGFSWLLFVRSMAGAPGLIFGMLADRYGRRRIMAVGLLCQSVGVLGVAVSEGWWAISPMIFFGLALPAFIPAEQAYISDQVAYEKRGRALAIIEFSWALAGMITLPIVGWLIDAYGWRSPFLLLGGLSFFIGLVVWFLLPTVEQRSTGEQNWREMIHLLRRPNVLASMGMGLLLFIGVTGFATLWGIWLSADFGLTAVALGLVATAIGVAELAGSGLSGLFIDRLGKRRGSQIGLAVVVISFLLLPVSRLNFYSAVLNLVLLGVCLEFTIVSLIPLYSEQAPKARATIFALVGLGVSVGASVGAPLTAILWEQVGLGAVAVMGSVTALLSLGLLWRFLPEHTTYSG